MPVPQVINTRLASLPFDMREAVVHMALTRLVNQRVNDGYYKDRLVILATQEKSSSTLHEVAVNEMLRHSGNVAVVVPPPRTLIAGPTEMGGGASFHFGMLLFFPNGGVCRGEFEPNWQNRRLIDEEIGCRRIALARHPADRIVAQYCMRPGEMTTLAAQYNSPSVFQYRFRSQPKGVDSLRHNLRWLSGWIREAEVLQTLIVRYEDMMHDIDAHFGRIHSFLYDAPMTPELVLALHQHFRNSGEGGSLQPGDAGGRVYAKGYSGKIGVWRDYLSSEDITVYNEVTNEFLSSNEDGSKLLDLYPDLLLQ